MTRPTTTLTIDRRFCGPPDSGNGGYVCGVLAQSVDGDAEITLRMPPPLHRPLEVVTENGTVRLRDGEAVVAEAALAAWELDVPEPPTLAEAEAAAQGYTGFDRHAFPTCFVCGPRRRAGDGLRIFTGPLDGTPLVAAPWAPDASLSEDGVLVRPEFIWAALDCPGGFAVTPDLQERPVLLGRLAARIHAPVRIDQTYVAVGWPIARDGRKLFAGTALFTADGACCARARATWIEVAR